MRKAPLYLALALLPAAFSCPVAAAGGAAGSDVVARVGGADLTTDDVRAFIDTLPPAEQEALAKDPAKLSQTVRVYLARQLVLKEALSKKFDQKPETKAQLERIRDAALGELYLQATVKLPDGFPSDADLQAAYDANKSAFMAPRQYHLAQIFIAAPKGDKPAEDKGKAKLDEVTSKLKSRGADFAAQAALFSDAKGEAAKGGEIGWVPESQLVPDIRQAISGLSKDGVSDVIRMDDGWHIIKLMDTKPAGILPLAEVKGPLTEKLRQAKGQQLRQAYLGQLLAQDPPAVNEMALSKIILKK